MWLHFETRQESVAIQACQDGNHSYGRMLGCWSQFSSKSRGPIFSIQLSRLYLIISYSSVQFGCSVMSNSFAASQASLSINSAWSLLKFMSIESVMPSNHLILCRPLLLLPSNFPSIWVFSNESALHISWPKYWSFSFNISPFNEYSGLISFSIDWLDLLAVQGTLKSLLEHHSSKASLFRCSAFFIVQLSHPYMTSGKTIALARWTFVGKVMSLLILSEVELNSDSWCSHKFVCPRSCEAKQTEISAFGAEKGLF